MENTKNDETKNVAISNKEIAIKLAKNPAWILTHLELKHLSNVIEIGKSMLPEKAKKEIEIKEKELQELKEKYK